MLMTGLTKILLTDFFCVVSLLLISCSSSLIYIFSPNSMTYLLLIIFVSNNTGCPRRNGHNFGRVFLMLKYTDITQNTYIQS